MKIRPMRTLATILAAALCGACSITQMDFRHLPPRDALESIRAGVTTRAEVLNRLGPPEEMRRPANFDRARLTTVQHRRILEEGRVFGDDVYTYVSSRRRTQTVGILPIGPRLLAVSRTGSREERWRIEFGGDDVVRSVSHVDELEEAGR